MCVTEARRRRAAEWPAADGGEVIISSGLSFSDACQLPTPLTDTPPTAASYGGRVLPGVRQSASDVAAGVSHLLSSSPSSYRASFSRLQPVDMPHVDTSRRQRSAVTRRLVTHVAHSHTRSPAQRASLRHSKVK